MARKPLLPPQGRKRQAPRRTKPLSLKVIRARAQLCEMLELIHEVNSKEASEHYGVGDNAAGMEASAIAAEAKLDGRKWGCSWA